MTRKRTCLLVLLFLISPSLSNGQWTPESIFKADSDGVGFISDIALSDAADLFVVGSFSDTLRLPGVTEEWVSRGLSDMFLMRMTSELELQWLVTAGGNSEAYCIPQFGVAPDRPSFLRIHENALYMAGWFRHEADFNNDAITDVSGNSDECNYFLAKYDLEGNFLWASSSGRTYMDRPSGLVITPSGSIFVSGSFDGAFEYEDASEVDPDLISHAFVDRFDSGGNLVSSREIGGASNEDNYSIVYGLALYLDAQNRLHFFTRYTGNLTLDTEVPWDSTCDQPVFAACKLSIRFDDAFEIDAVGDELLFSPELIKKDQTGNTIVLNSPLLDIAIFNKTHTLRPPFNTDYSINYYDEFGVLSWTHTTEASSSYTEDGSYAVYPTSLHVAPNKTILVGGFIQNGNIDLDSDGLTDLSVPYRNAFIAHYDEEGVLLNTITLNHAEANNDNYLLIYDLINVGATSFVASGVFRGTVQLDPELSTNSISAEGEQDGILIRYSTGDTPLPVSLSSFGVTVNDHVAHLNWQTTSETNNAGFAVLHNDVEIAFVEGSGTTNNAQYYTFHTPQLLSGEHTFQLKQIDFDGAFELSKQVFVTIDLDRPYALSHPYPNPFNPQTTFTLQLARDQEVSIALFDVSGRQVQTIFEGQLLANTAHTFVIDGSQLPSGTYMYQILGTHFRKSGQVTLLK